MNFGVDILAAAVMISFGTIALFLVGAGFLMVLGGGVVAYVMLRDKRQKARGFEVVSKGVPPKSDGES